MKSIKKEFDNRIEYQNEQGLLHRTDGPAIEYKDGTKAWFINDKIHREDGPAIQYPSGHNQWYLNDTPYSEQNYYQEIAKIKLKRILNL